jgi:hypothetical protein
MRAKKFKLPEIGNLNSERVRRVREVVRHFFTTEERRIESEAHDLEDSAQTTVQSHNEDEWPPREASKADSQE